jgi:hypothetical protein
LILIAAWSALLYFGAGPFIEWITRLPDYPAAEEFNRSIELTFLSLACVIGGWGIYRAVTAFRLFRIANLVESSGQHPPPGVRLLFPTTIRRGPRLGQVVFYYRFTAACHSVTALFALWTATEIATI